MASLEFQKRTIIPTISQGYQLIFSHFYLSALADTIFCLTTSRVAPFAFQKRIKQWLTVIQPIFRPIFYLSPSANRHTSFCLADVYEARLLRCFHICTFGAHPGSIDIRVQFVWMMWTLSSELGCAPANRTWVHLKERVVWGTVHVNSCTVRCWCECNHTKSRKWTAINDVLFDKNVCLCFTHFPDECDWRAASRKLYVSYLFAFSVL